MKTLASAFCCAAALTALCSPVPAQAKEAGDFLIRVRAIFIQPAEETELTLRGTGAIPGEADADFNPTGEIDFSYFFTDNIAAELIAATSRHEVTASGTPLGDFDVGKVMVLPPTLTLQYHFFPDQAFSPYLGAGINWTIYWGVEDSPPVDALDFKNDVGIALQFGFDYQFDERFLFNVDVKKIFVDADAKITVNGLIVDGEVDLNPWIIGVGFGYRF